MKIYVSGSIKDNPNHREQFNKFCEYLRQWDPTLEVVNPMDIPACPDGRCKKTGHIVLASGHTWECYMRYDIPELLKCDAIIMMDGWKISRGAQFELYTAMTCGLTVFTERDWTFE